MTWRVTRVELIDPTATTQLTGGAMLLGAGVTAWCIDGVDTTALLTITVVDGRLVASGVDVRRPGQVGGVTATGLHRIPVRRLIREAFTSLDAGVWAAQEAVDATERMREAVETWLGLQGGPQARRATAETAVRLRLSRGYVSRLLTRARNDGILPR